ncbi:uncharacterized protein ARMOST_01513 [Armillaria ostoyae]|uniref:Reverse transcriptase n=1 Tax=Armillaria ostoyae TaxID=47428 RepID=A0A284QP52_ARMOS|nr:uncharacterized protein ARMOST_01513 [Armillaria ostoyae]
MEAAQAKMATYDTTWDFNQPPATDKGKNPHRGRPAAPTTPNYRRPLHTRSDRWSVPCPPPKWQAPDPYPAPVGEAPDEAPWLGVKPLMVKPLLPFEGKYDDVERFNFHDPVSEELHEKCMFDLRMGKGPAISYFQELEVEAKKANRCGDTDARGLMVKAVRLGVPDSYTNAIANSGQHVPVTYNDWKRRVCIMYEERQKKWVFDQVIGGRSNTQTKGTTATSLPKTGGATSSTPAKQTGNSSAPAKGRDGAGQWTTHPRQGLPMSIDAQKLCDEGRCFRCKEKGHMSKDCPRKKEFQDIRSVQVTEPVTGSKVEEDLHIGTPFNPISITTHSDTDFFDTHPVISAPNLLAFNISSTTSAPVSESQNRYAALSVEECNDNDNDDLDIPLKGCSDTSPARAQAKAVNPAGHEAESLSTHPLRKLGQTDAKRHASSLRGETQPTNALGGKSPTIVTPIDNASLPHMTDGTTGSSKGSPHEASSKDEQAAQTFGSTTPKVDVESQLGGETTTRLPGQERVLRNPKGDSTFHSSPPSSTKTGEEKDGAEREPQRVGVTGTTVLPRATTQVRPVGTSGLDTPTREPSSQRTKGGTLFNAPRPAEERPLNAAGVANATATKEIAVGLEAASAQAVNRGHSVTCIEVPDKDDDTAFQLWLAKEQTPAVAKKEATSDEPAQSSPTKSDPHRWLKPFEVDWTLRAICEAQNDNTARAALFVWTHVDCIPELTPELLSELRKGDELAWERLYELCEPPRYLRRRQSDSRDFMLNVQLTTVTDRQTLVTRGLVDSGCTSSAINHAFVQKHRLDTVKTAIPIIVYNADGSQNKGGAKDLYLGHDWLKRHNPVINWETGTIIFGHCPCVKNPFPLPDADPDDRWDEELEDEDTILAVNMEEELVIRAVHHANDLAAAAHAEKPIKTFKEMVPSDYRSFRDLFSKENFDELPERKPWDHAIKLVPNAKSTLDCKVYPLNRNEQEQLDKFLDENLESGRITESKSPFASPFFFVKKKDGSLRPIQDYRKLNEMTIKNRYPLPLISELIDKLQGAKYFTKLDVRWGYNNVRIKEGDKHKAAFRMNRGLFEPTVMFFGLTNSPATFQWMMNDIFKDLISEGKVTIYLNDILIFTKDLDEHRRIVRRVLQKLRENKLFLKAEKCEFEVLETEYLGVIISEGQVRMDPVKLAGIAEWPTPTKKKELQSFLGFTNFYRKFIKNYSKVVRALTQLTGNAEWTWGAAQNQAFQQLKKQMAEDVILAIPNATGCFRVKADASNGAIGAILSQEQDGKWRPVAFMSKALTATK